MSGFLVQWVLLLCHAFCYEFSTCLCFYLCPFFGMFWFVSQLCSPVQTHSLISLSMYSLLFVCIVAKFNCVLSLLSLSLVFIGLFCCMFWFWPSRFSLGFKYGLSFFDFSRYRHWIRLLDIHWVSTLEACLSQYYTKQKQKVNKTFSMSLWWNVYIFFLLKPRCQAMLWTCYWPRPDF